MYRSNLGSRNKGTVLATVIAVHAALLFAMLHRWPQHSLVDPRQPAIKVFDVNQPAPPPPSPSREQPRPLEKAGGSGPKNIRSEVTEVAVPKPQIRTPSVQEIAAAETPGEGAQPTQGASDALGPGAGSGGAGNGAGSGNGGNGPGGGGGGVAEPPHLASPVLRGRDIPRALLDQWPSGATVFMRLRVDARGYVSECTVDRGTGVAAIDQTLCNVAHDRLRFRPALDRSGQAVAGWFGYAQPAPR